MGRSRLTIQLTRITLSLPIALERALEEQRRHEAAAASVYSERETSQTCDSCRASGDPCKHDIHDQKIKDKSSNPTLFPRHITLLIRGVDIALERMERILK